MAWGYVSDFCEIIEKEPDRASKRKIHSDSLELWSAGPLNFYRTGGDCSQTIRSRFLRIAEVNYVRIEWGTS